MIRKLIILFVLLFSLTTYVFGMSVNKIEEYIGAPVIVRAYDVNPPYSLKLYRGTLVDVVTLQIDSSYLGTQEESFALVSTRTKSYIIPCGKIKSIKVGN